MAEFHDAVVGEPFGEVDVAGAVSAGAVRGDEDAGLALGGGYSRFTHSALRRRNRMAGEGFVG